MCRKKISVVIPMYNRREKIGRALDSVFLQTGAEAIGEIIVIDDGSTDDSVEFVKSYRESHKSIDIVIIEQANHGPSRARNKGMEIARYDLIAFLDSDDEWLPCKITEQLKVFNEYKDADFVGSNWLDSNFKILFKPIKKLHKATLTELCLKSFPVTPSVMLKKSIFDSIGGFDETIRCYEDCDYFQRICAGGWGYYFIPKKLVAIDDKKPFGESGLSANLKQANVDSIISLNKLRDNKDISLVFYIFLRVFYGVKYIRRIILASI